MTTARIAAALVAALCWTGVALAEAPPSGATKTMPTPATKDSSEELLAKLHLARVHFVDRDMTSAASDLRSAATLLLEDAQNAAPSAQKLLVAMVSQVDSLASNVGSSRVTQVAELDATLGRVNYAVSRDHYARFQANWFKADYAAAGKDLRTATAHLESALRRKQDKLAKALTDDIESFQTLASQLSSGQRGDREQVLARTGAFRKRLDQLKSQVAPLPTADE